MINISNGRSIIPLLVLAIFAIGRSRGQDEYGTESLFVKSNWRLVRDDSLKVVQNPKTRSLDTVLFDKYLTADDSTEPGYYYEESSRVISVAGHFLSYDLSYSGSGGMHPVGGGYYRTIDLRTGKEVSLETLFDPDEILTALLRDTNITKYSTRLPSVNLRDFIASLDGDCAIQFIDMLSSFAIKSITQTVVVVEFGLTHGCEVMRGNFTLFTIRLPVRAMFPGFYDE